MFFNKLLDIDLFDSFSFLESFNSLIDKPEITSISLFEISNFFNLSTFNCVVSKLSELLN